MIYKDEISGVGIRPFDPDLDITKEYINWFYDPDVTRHNSHGLRHYSEEEMRGHSHKKHSIVWAIDYKNKHVGNVSLQNINHINRSAELSIIIGDKSTWRRGVGSVACGMVLKHGFAALGLNRIRAGTARSNIGMQKICVNIGMQQEGVLREGQFLHGVFVDVLTFGILKAEYYHIAEGKK